MKKFVYVTLFMALFSTSLWAQRGGGDQKREKVDALKIGFITKKLDLSAEEAQKFWPVYNKYHDELEKTRVSLKALHMEYIGRIDKLTAAEAEKVLQEMHQIKNKELEINQQYSLEFKKVLPVQKVVKLYLAEHEFKRELLRQLKGERRP